MSCDDRHQQKYDMALFGIPDVQTKMLRAGHKHRGSSVP